MSNGLKDIPVHHLAILHQYWSRLETLLGEYHRFGRDAEQRIKRTPETLELYWALNRVTMAVIGPRTLMTGVNAASGVVRAIASTYKNQVMDEFINAKMAGEYVPMTDSRIKERINSSYGFFVVPDGAGMRDSEKDFRDVVRDEQMVHDIVYSVPGSRYHEPAHHYQLRVWTVLGWLLARCEKVLRVNDAQG